MKTAIVTQNLVYNDFKKGYQDELTHDVIEYFNKFNISLIPISNKKYSEKLLLDIINNTKAKILILTGGNNISKNLNKNNRDILEKKLIKIFLKKRYPILGICRGMQILNVFFNGKISKIDGHVRKNHKLIIDKNFDYFLPKTVNSYHNFCIPVCPEGYIIISKSDDNIIEAIKHRSLPWEGWMWHPEREANFTKRDVERLKALFGI